MKKEEWRIFHGFTGREMEEIESLLKMFSGKIVSVTTKKEEGVRNERVPMDYSNVVSRRSSDLRVST